MFRRRVFYDLSTGEVLRSAMAQGDLKLNYTPAQEAAELNFTNWGVIAWSEPNETIEAQFAPYDAEDNPRIVNVVVDITASPPALVFSYESSPETETGDDPYAIIDALTGEDGIDG